MNAAFIALGGANPGLLPLAFIDTAAGSSYTPTRRRKAPLIQENFCRPRERVERDLPEGQEAWENTTGMILGLVGVFFLLALAVSMLP